MSRTTSSIDSPGFFRPSQPEFRPSTYSGTNPLPLLHYIIHEFPSTSHANNVHRFGSELSLESRRIRQWCAVWVSNYPDPSLAYDHYLLNNLTWLGNFMIQVSCARTDRWNRLSEWDSALRLLGLSGEMGIGQVEYLEAVLHRTISCLHAYWGDGVHHYASSGLELANTLVGLRYYLQQQRRLVRRISRRRNHITFAARYARRAPLRMPERHVGIEYASEEEWNFFNLSPALTVAQSRMHPTTNPNLPQPQVDGPSQGRVSLSGVLQDMHTVFDAGSPEGTF